MLGYGSKTPNCISAGFLYSLLLCSLSSLSTWTLVFLVREQER